MDLSMMWSWVSRENSASGAAADCEGAGERKCMWCVKASVRTCGGSVNGVFGG